MLSLDTLFTVQNYSYSPTFTVIKLLVKSTRKIKNQFHIFFQHKILNFYFFLNIKTSSTNYKSENDYLL